jgi:hypothetical protein
MNFALKTRIESQPENKNRRIIKEVADFVGHVVDMIPTGSLNWLWLVTNWRTAIEITRLTIELVKRIKNIINE